ncbi:MAG: hypothetical protein IT380_20710 [Myxococcales bacterium]|nr:hypothetical protein [Myxococcales bacterium]
MSPERTSPPQLPGSSQEEVEEILQRATELERVRQVEKAGLSQADIEALARESGLDPTVLKRAARDVAQRRQDKGNVFIGAPTRRTFERVVDGELSADQHEQLAAEIVEAVRGLTPFSGQLAAVGRTLTWNGMTTGGLVSISVIPRDGKTVIRVEVNARQLAGGLFGGIVGGVGGGLGPNVGWILPGVLHWPVAAGMVGATAVVVGAWAIARAAFKSRVTRVYDVMSALADSLEDRTSKLVVR